MIFIKTTGAVYLFPLFFYMQNNCMHKEQMHAMFRNNDPLFGSVLSQIDISAWHEEDDMLTDSDDYIDHYIDIADVKLSKTKKDVFPDIHKMTCIECGKQFSRYNKSALSCKMRTHLKKNHEWENERVLRLIPFERVQRKATNIEPAT